MNSLSTLSAPSSSHLFHGFPSMVNGFHGHVGYGDEIKPFPSLTHGEPPTWKKVLQVAKETFANIAKEFYKYFKLTTKVLKNILKAITVVFTDTEEKVGKAIAYLGLGSILKAAFNLKSIYDDSIELDNCIKIQDAEGIAWSTMDLLVKPFDIASNLLSFGKSLDKIVGITWIALFSAVVFPLSLALLCYETVKSLYNTIMIGIELSEMPNWDCPDHYAEFSAYLEKKVGVTREERSAIEQEIGEEFLLEFEDLKHPRLPRDAYEAASPNREFAANALDEIKRVELNRRIEVLKDRKINRLGRHTDKKIAAYMLKAKEFIEANPGKDQKAAQALDDLKKMTVRKLILNSGETLFNIADLILTVVSMIFPLLTPILPITLSLANTGFSVGKKFYQEYGMTSGLANPEFLAD